MDLNKLFQFVFPSGNCTDVDVNFFDNEELILNHIKKHDAVIGCVPWITNHKIIKALSELKYGTCIITDKNSMKGYIKRYLAKFNEIKTLDFEISRLPTNNSYFDNNEIKGNNTSSIRVFGKPKKGITPLLHYKFLILCDIDNEKNIVLRSVIAGSFNLSSNATNSREMLLTITEPYIVKCFYYEWSKAFILSENVNNFSKVEIDPEFLNQNTAKEIIKNIDDENRWLEWEEMKSLRMDENY